MTSGTADSWSVAVLVIRCQLAATLGKAETLPLRRQQNSGGRYNRHDQIENELFYAAEIERRFEAVNYNCRQTIKQPPGKCERGQSKNRVAKIPSCRQNQRRASEQGRQRELDAVDALRKAQQRGLVMILREDTLHAGKGIEEFNCRDKDETHARPTI